MGLLDSMSGLSTGDNLGDLGLIGGLLSARMGQGGPAPLIFQAAAMRQQMQKQERENRANDLQQLSGTYNLLKQQEFGRMIQAQQSGPPYAPNPQLAQLEARMTELLGKSNLSSGQPVMPPQQAQQRPQAPQQQLPQGPMQAPQQGPQMPPQGPPQGPPQQSPGLNIGGPAAGIPAQVWLAQDPTGKTYLEQLAKDRAPQNVRPGGTLATMGPDGKFSSAFYAPQLAPGVVPQRGPDGNASGASELPGFGSAVANIKGKETAATEEAKAPYDIKMVDVGGGRIVPMPVSQLKDKTPTQAQSGVASLTVTQPSRQSQIPQPKADPSDPFADAPKVPQPQGFGQTTYDSSLTKLRADHAAKLFETYGTAADEAQKRVALNNQALSVIDRADTGTGAALIGDVKKALTTRFGIPEEDFSNDPTATAVLQKDLLNAATQRAKQQFGARMTQSEVMMMLKRGAPNIDMTKASIKFLLDTDNAAANYAVQQANHYGEYISRGGDPLRFQGYYAKKFPLTKAEDSLTLGTGNDQVIRYDGNGKRVQ
jgi:hypothetical protein